MGSFFFRKALNFEACPKVFLAITGGLIRHLFPEYSHTFTRNPIGSNNEADDDDEIMDYTLDEDDDELLVA